MKIPPLFERRETEELRFKGVSWRFLGFRFYLSRKWSDL